MLAFFVLGSGVFAKTEVGQAFIGKKLTGVAGIDNKLLLEADLDNFDMNYRIEKIDEDQKYYYVTYTFLDLVENNQAWQYLIQEKIRKVSKKSRVDLPKYLAKEFTQMYDTRINYLREEQISAQMIGVEKRVATEKYSGLIGASLDVVSSVFSNFNAVKTKELPSPTIPASVLPARKITKIDTNSASADSITNVYSDYIQREDPDRDDVFGVLDNCPNDYNPDQADANDDGVGDACADVINNDKGNDEATGTDEVEDVATGTEDVEGVATGTNDVEDVASGTENIEDVATGTEDVATGTNDVVDTDKSVGDDVDATNNKGGEDSVVEEVGDAPSDTDSALEDKSTSSENNVSEEAGGEALEPEPGTGPTVEEAPGSDDKKDSDVVIIEL